MLYPQFGSSPRGRGTPQADRILKSTGTRRFIPARAGNTESASVFCPDLLRRRFIPARAGNTTARARSVGGQYRFIPARAGNTPFCAPMPVRCIATVHPRAGGEHQDAKSRARRGRTRFIPARAGNTESAGSRVRTSTVHPRAGGEHSSRNRMIQRVFSNVKERTSLKLPGFRDWRCSSNHRIRAVIRYMVVGRQG